MSQRAKIFVVGLAVLGFVTGLVAATQFIAHVFEGQPALGTPQVIVLSHDKYFLDAMRRKIHGAPWASKQISMTQSNSALEDWDIEWEVKEGYLQDHMELSDFADGIEGDVKDMRTKMRPLLEKYIRYRFPNQIAEGDWLGEMCATIRNDPTHPLRSQLTELDDINEYTAPFHHDPNTAFNADEVMAHVKRTLAIVGG